MHHGRRLVVAFALASVMAAVACDDGGDTATPRGPQTTAGEVVPDSLGGTGGGRWLSDANVLSLFQLVNSHQITVAQIELAAWHSDTIRSFAAATLNENAQLQASVDSVARRINTTPAAPALDSIIEPPLKAEVDSLKQYKGAQLDQLFLAHAIQDHSAYVNFLGQLAAAAERPELRDVLLQSLGKEQLHVARGKAVRAIIAVAASDSSKAKKGQ